MDAQLSMPDWHGILNDPGIAALSFQDGVLDNPPVTTRAGLYIYLNAMLHCKPSFDDLKVITLLNTRYNEDIPTLISDLILASFDVLANIISRGESTRSRTIIRSFIVNELPIFVQANYAGLIFEPLTTEHCIRQALSRVDQSSSQSFDVLSETRQEFLFACALHEMIPESSIEDILGDVPMQSLPAGGRYYKNDLLTQIATNPSSVDQLVNELENMEGNSGAISIAIVEFMHSLCASNDTMTLKGICNALSRKPAALDVIMLFTLSDMLLRPFCQIIDNWPEHEDQGEYQPVYDEFGSIILFIAAVRYRFNLKSDELGLDYGNSWVTRYFNSGSTNHPIEELSQHQSDLLASWIKGLYETEGISDELMSTCKPSEFHLLIATLFDQSLKACHAKVLSLETLKGGFEYLLEPFLLPSLVGGLKWFADQLWNLEVGSPTIDVIMQALHALLKPSRMSSESSMMHNAILHIVARPLQISLVHAQQRFPSRQDFKPLNALLASFNTDTEGRAILRELASWAVTPKGGMLTALRTSIEQMVLWSATVAATADMAPPAYTFELMRSSVQILGAYKVLDVLIDEIQSSDLPDVTLDVVSILVLAIRHMKPSENQANGQRLLGIPMTIQAILQSKFDEAAELAKTDATRASTIVRLHRRVEACTGRTSISMTTHAAFMQDAVSNVNNMPVIEIDDVLAEAGANAVAQQDYLDGQNDALMGIA